MCNIDTESAFRSGSGYLLVAHWYHIQECVYICMCVCVRVGVVHGVCLRALSLYLALSLRLCVYCLLTGYANSGSTGSACG